MRYNKRHAPICTECKNVINRRELRKGFREVCQICEKGHPVTPTKEQKEALKFVKKIVQETNKNSTKITHFYHAFQLNRTYLISNDGKVFVDGDVKGPVYCNYAEKDPNAPVYIKATEFLYFIGFPIHRLATVAYPNGIKDRIKRLIDDIESMDSPNLCLPATIT